MGGEIFTAHRLIIPPYRAHILCAHDRVSASYASERLKSIRLYFLYFLGDCIPTDADARNDAALRIDYDQNGVVESFHSRDSSIDSTCLLSQSGYEIFGLNPTIRL